MRKKNLFKFLAGHSIDFAKFLEILYLESQKADPVNEISQAFNSFKGRGFINKSELASLLTTFGEKMGKEEVEVVLKAMKIEGEIVPIAKIINYLQ